MTSRSSPGAKNVGSEPPEKQSGLPRSLRSLARTGGYYCLKKNASIVMNFTLTNWRIRMQYLKKEEIKEI
ncbi:MAG: hypothetical protein ACFN4U_03605, partial [Candidatus Absconditicoccaceae bacterium]